MKNQVTGRRKALARAVGVASLTGVALMASLGFASSASALYRENVCTYVVAWPNQSCWNVNEYHTYQWSRGQVDSGYYAGLLCASAWTQAGNQKSAVGNQPCASNVSIRTTTLQSTTPTSRTRSWFRDPFSNGGIPQQGLGLTTSGATP